MQFKTVLVIEDDHDVRVTLRNVLEDSGFYVFTVTNGKSALELLDVIPTPKIIICDMMMPMLNGDEFLKIKSTHSKLADVPIILISAFEDQLKGRDLPQLKKPLDLKELVSTVEQFMVPGNFIKRRSRKPSLT